MVVFGHIFQAFFLVAQSLCQGGYLQASLYVKLFVQRGVREGSLLALFVADVILSAWRLVFSPESSFVCKEWDFQPLGVAWTEGNGATHPVREGRPASGFVCRAVVPRRVWTEERTEH